MKIPRPIIVACFVAVAIAVVLEARMIRDLRAEVAALRKDLQTSLDTALDDATRPSTGAGLPQRENLELIKLRNQVRELKESLAEAHTKEPKTGLRAAINVLLPSPISIGPWKFRPEWQGMESLATNQYAQSMQSLAVETNEFMRYLHLERAAMMSFAVGRTDDARRFVTDMMVLDDKFSRGVSEKSNGDVVHTGNIVLGRIALDEGRVEEARRHLLAAGASRGSPVLCSFGPSMSLAKELLAKGDQETVLRYFELCRKFWNSEKLEEWTKDIHEGRIPEFGSNVLR